MKYINELIGDPFFYYLVALSLIIWAVISIVAFLIMIRLLLKNNDEKPTHYPGEVNWLLELDEHELRLSE